MKLLDNYNKALEAIYEYFGYKEDWEAYPIDDAREYWWLIDHNHVIFFDSKEDFAVGDMDKSYENEIIRSLHQPSIYQTRDYTMILVDTHADRNEFLQIFDNSKRLK
jgi:hypothetical protein